MSSDLCILVCFSDSLKLLAGAAFKLSDPLT
jgi:hypothetical protein